MKNSRNILRLLFTKSSTYKSYEQQNAKFVHKYEKLFFKKSMYMVKNCTTIYLFHVQQANHVIQENICTQKYTVKA